MIDADDRRKLRHIVLVPAVLDNEDGIFCKQAPFVKDRERPLPESFVIWRVAEDEIECAPLMLEPRKARKSITCEDFRLLLEMAVADVFPEDVRRRLVEEDFAPRESASRPRLPVPAKTSSTVRPETMEPRML